jgi:hypothetical protein
MIMEFGRAVIAINLETSRSIGSGSKHPNGTMNIAATTPKAHSPIHVERDPVVIVAPHRKEPQ